MLLHCFLAPCPCWCPCSSLPILSMCSVSSCTRFSSDLSLSWFGTMPSSTAECRASTSFMRAPWSSNCLLCACRSKETGPSLSFMALVGFAVTSRITSRTAGSIPSSNSTLAPILASLLALLL
ncbi:hypothetical protein ATANTOWER_006124 [Ataeniobius toweri]|uniref:Secreted protein n=1 Tax=Ataeniobius toweri TaxID=208326 RepID=A0ABU7BEC7_9TELE|nr:hypothetical protein [Ataeniobius toweri]